MQKQIMEKLGSPNVAQRRQAVVALANSGDPDTVDILNRVASSDEDDGVRELAQKAADHVRKMQWQRAQASVPAAPAIGPTTIEKVAPEINTNTARPVIDPNINVSFEKKKMARSRLDSAFRWRVDGFPAKAIVDLKRAIQLDPSLAKDGSAQALSADLMSAGTEESIELLMGYEAPKAGANAKAAGVALGEVLAFLLEGSILFALPLITIFVLYNRVMSEITGRSDLSFGLSEINIIAQKPNLIIGSIANYIITSLFLYTVMFFLGIFIGGSGSLIKFIRTMMRITAVAEVIAILLVFVPIMTPSLTRTLDLRHNLILYLLGVLVLYFGLQFYFAGRAHGFGFFKGCATVIGGWIAASFILWLFTAIVIAPSLQQVTR